MFANEEEKTKDRKNKALRDEKETKEESEIADESMTQSEDENLKKTHEEFENIPDDFLSYEEGEVEEEEEFYILRCEICR